MSCYLRHLAGVFTQAGITLEKENRKQVDSLVREWAGQQGVKCNVAWKEMKAKMVSDGESSLVDFLKKNS